jgi:hypothetical protein
MRHTPVKGEILMRRYALVTAFACLVCFSAYPLDVTSWVPAYGVNECYDNLTADFGGISPSDVVSLTGLQFWWPDWKGYVDYIHCMGYTDNYEGCEMVLLVRTANHVCEKSAFTQRET